MGEEILEFFMALTVQTHLSVLTQKIPVLWPGAKGVGDREILETYLNSASKNTSETDIFPHGPKSFLASVSISIIIIIIVIIKQSTFYLKNY